MKLFTVLGCVTDIEGAVPYLCQPAADKETAVDAWYIVACENIGVEPDAFPPESAEHEDLIDTAHALRTCNIAFLNGEALALQRFELGEA
jgi:hypothetical protein